MSLAVFRCFLGVFACFCGLVVAGFVCERFSGVGRVVETIFGVFGLYSLR